MRKSIGKRLAVGIAAAAMVMASTATAFAAEWKQNEIGWWYENEDGTYPVNSWIQVNGVWYFFNQEGYMSTGWVWDDGNWYFTNSDGAMLTGWVEVDNKSYYLNPISDGYKGAMATGTKTIDGEEYTFEESGACTSEYQGPSEEYYGNGTKVTDDQTGTNGPAGGSGSASGSGSTDGSDSSNDDSSDETVLSLLEQLNMETAQKVQAAVNDPQYQDIIAQNANEDKPIKKVSKVSGTTTDRSITVTLGSKEIQEATPLSDIKALVNDIVDAIVNVKEVESVSYLGYEKTVVEVMDHLNSQFDSDRTLATMSSEYKIHLVLTSGEKATYTLYVNK